MIFHQVLHEREREKALKLHDFQTQRSLVKVQQQQRQQQQLPPIIVVDNPTLSQNKQESNNQVRPRWQIFGPARLPAWAYFDLKCCSMFTDSLMTKLLVDQTVHYSSKVSDHGLRIQELKRYKKSRFNSSNNFLDIGSMLKVTICGWKHQMICSIKLLSR